MTLVLNINKLFQGLQIKAELCGLCAAVSVCLDSAKPAPPLSRTWYLSCGSRDGGRGGSPWWLWQTGCSSVRTYN